MQGSVTAIMLYADRPEFLDRSVAAFRVQTYERKRLLILDNGRRWIRRAAPDFDERGISMFPVHNAGATIGALRNAANALSESDILVHWDVDDFSHPNRIAEQVALLQASGADCVGYREMPFWREAGQREYDPGQPGMFYSNDVGEAWLYLNGKPSYCLGTSLCYWRRVWEQRSFEATNQGEDVRWIAGVRSVGTTALGPEGNASEAAITQARMIARIHAGNTSNAYRPDVMAAIERQGGEWKRMLEWDEACRRVME